MADIVNLNKVRKAKSKADKAQTAEQNRVKFGRTKAEKQRDAQHRAAFERGVDLHERDLDETDPDAPTDDPKS